MIVDPNISSSDLTDEEIINEYNNPKKYSKRSLYGVMAKRAAENNIIKDILFDIIISDEARNKTEMGFIMHSWLPAIFILQEAKDSVKLELREILKTWTKDEKETFLFYIKKEPEYYCLLYDI